MPAASATTPSECRSLQREKEIRTGAINHSPEAATFWDERAIE
jgi:hypothetical protein